MNKNGNEKKTPSRIKKKAVMTAAALLSGAIIAAPLMLNASDAYASTNGKTAAQAIAWVKSKVGTGIDMDGAYGNQCVDLTKAYYKYLGQSPVRGNGCDYAYNAKPSGWSRLKNAKPQKGDVLVYTGGWGGYGHVAIYESDYSTYHQNWNGHAYVERVTNWKYNSSGSIHYWGVIRPDFVKSKSASSGTSSSNTSSAGLKKVNGVICYVKNNKVVTSVNGLVKASDGNWYYLKNGRNVTSYTGLVRYNSSWYYVKNGKYIKSFTGLCKYNGTWYYVKNGKVNRSYTGLVYHGGKWWYVKGGVLNKSYEGLVKYGNSWWYVKSGVVNKSYTGLAKGPSGKLYYVKNGKYTTAFSGKVNYKGKTYTVKNGAV